MSKFGYLLVPSFVLAMAFPAFGQAAAQDDKKDLTPKAQAHSMEFQPYGWANLYYRYNNLESSVLAPFAKDSAGYLDARVGFKWAFTEKMSLDVYIENDQVAGGAITPLFSFSDTIHFGAIFRAEDVLTPDLDLTLGIQNPVANKWASSKDESSTFAPNGTRSGVASTLAGTTMFGVAAHAQLWGASVHFGRPNFDLNVGWGVLESETGVDQESVWWILGSYLMEKNRIGARIWGYHPLGTEVNIYNLGLNVEWWLMDNALGLAGAVDFQFGEVSPTIDHSALAFELGVFYMFKSDLKPWVELAFNYKEAQDPTDADHTQYVSFQRDNSSYVTAYRGYNLPTFWRVALRGGAAFNVGSTPNSLEVKGTIAYYGFTEDATSAGAVVTPVAAGGDSTFGFEVSIDARYWVIPGKAHVGLGLSILFLSGILDLDDSGSLDSTPFTFGVEAGVRF